MKNLILIILVIPFLFSCNKKENVEFRLVIECSIPEPYKLELKENDFEKVDWINQEYYLKSNLVEDFKFNNKVCFGACRLTSFLGNEKKYEAILYCDMAPNNLSTNGNHTIFIKAGDETLNLLYQDKLQLNLNDRRKISKDAKKQKSLSTFLYDEDIKTYLNQKSLLK